MSSIKNFNQSTDNCKVKVNDLIVYNDTGFFTHNEIEKYENIINTLFGTKNTINKNTFNVGVVVNVKRCSNYYTKIKVLNNQGKIKSLDSFNSFKIISSCPGEK